ncbi:hypothetical protein BO71DRAFT_486827 [Aspergillus ellipticus CBS 707.79]|uniref:Protein ZIP4 homolog n=1 Tax=Aspergillus ellipticus CBS 707.79 TaxID=1448320 RepID=A0A319D8G2_9EURO|nr:hypothetical protein BO71DRAFT_486827 [Aspergillus ellipticus CBS 707.79]
MECESLKPQVEAVLAFTGSLSPSTRPRFDQEGTKLWNVCLQLMTMEKNTESLESLCRVKTLAFMLLEAAAPSRGPGCNRALEAAFKMVATCIEHGCLDLSQKIIETVAVRLDKLEKSEAAVDEPKLQQFSMEYYMVRVYLAWLQGRPDIADHLFSKMPKSDQKCQECVMDICYKVGNLALSRRQHDVAAKWLERALKAYELISDGVEQPALSLKDKGILILHSSVRANLHIDSAESKDYVGRTMSYLKAQYGDLFPVQMIQLEFLSREELKGDVYHQLLQDAIFSFELQDASIKLILHYIQKLQDSSPDHYVHTLKQLPVSKIAVSHNEGNSQLLEQVFVNFVCGLTRLGSCNQRVFDIFKDTTSELNRLGQKPLGLEATDASLIIIWKYINQVISDGDLSLAGQWCQFLLEDPILQISLENKTKLFRKLILCLEDNPNSSLLRNISHRIPETSRSCPATLYLVYKLSIHDTDPASGYVYLESLYKCGAEAIPYISACVAEAFRLEKAQNTIKSLQRILVSSKSDGLYNSKIFQCIIHFLFKELGNCKWKNEEILNDITAIFDIASRSASEEQEQDIELEWLARMSYKIALKSHTSAQLGLILRLLDLSTKFADAIKHQLNSEPSSNLSQHHLLCNFLKITRITADARKETNPTKKKPLYTEVHNLSTNIQNQITTITPTTSSTEPPQEPWLSNHRTILSLDLEASTYLNDWRTTSQIIETASPIIDDTLSAIFLDCILRSEAPKADIVRAVKTLLRTLHVSPSPYLNRSAFERAVPRYIRCLFQLSLDAAEDALAESVLDQALVLVGDGYQRPHSPSYPSDEIRWLATVAFNRAVDFYLAAGDAECRRWGEKAIMLADMVGDGCGGLGRLLRERFETLS